MKILRVLKTGHGVRAYDKSGKPVTLMRMSQFSGLEKISTPADSHSGPSSEYSAEQAYTSLRQRTELNYRYQQ